MAEEMGEWMMKNLRRNVGTITVTLILVLISAFCICGTAYSQEKGQSKEKAQYYREIEREYVNEIRELLEAKGYRNSGVTMTYIILEKGGREYTVMIHHKKISALDEDQKEELLNDCKKIEFPIEDCEFSHELLKG